MILIISASGSHVNRDKIAPGEGRISAGRWYY